MPQTQLRDTGRYETALRLRKEGKLFREIAAVLGVSGSRARQMVLWAANPRPAQEPRWTDGLREQVANALRAHGFKGIEEVRRVCERQEFGVGQGHQYVAGLGKKGVAEVYAWVGISQKPSAAQQQAVKSAIKFLERMGYRVEPQKPDWRYLADEVVIPKEELNLDPEARTALIARLLTPKSKRPE